MAPNCFGKNTVHILMAQNVIIKQNATVIAHVMVKTRPRGKPITIAN